MIRKWSGWLIGMILLCLPSAVKAQSQEVQQLLLNIEKLNQFRAILKQLKQGYEILSKGYQTIKDLSEGNFNIHKAFLDGLLEVSPTVKKYKRIVEIVEMQRQIVKSYKAALKQFSASDLFRADEINYIEKVYNDLVDRSLKNLEELLIVITAGKVRMNDARRLEAVDRIYDEMKDKLNFLSYFNNKSHLLFSQRKYLQQENKSLQDLFLHK